MPNRIVEHVFNGPTTSSYDSTKTYLGSLMRQNSGSTALDVWAGPQPIVLMNPGEGPANTITARIQTIGSARTNVDWLFFGDGNTASATRRVTMYEFNRTTSTFNLKGGITITPPASGTWTMTAFYPYQYLYTTGTVGVSGTAVTGSGTGWQTARYAVGARIGFGSTDPNQITAWHEIASINSDTSITLTSNAGTISSGTPFVIEELRLYLAMTNATTATNGGLYVVKGLHPDVFAYNIPTIPAATTVDNIRACYWLTDAATTTMTTMCGVVVDPVATNTNHDCYFIGGTTTIQIYKFNVRAALSLTAGTSTSAYLFKTGVVTPAQGALQTTGEGKIFSINHGLGAGKKCLWLWTSRIIYRIPLDQIQDSTTFFGDMASVENPPGGSNTFYGSAVGTVCYDPMTETLVTGAVSGTRFYMTKFATNCNYYEAAGGLFAQQIDGATSWPGLSPYPCTGAGTVQISVENGLMYAFRQSGSATTTQGHIVPVGAHWSFTDTTGQRIITPAINLPNLDKLLRLYVNYDNYLGSEVLGAPTEPYRIFARTTGIADNTGEWTRIADTGELTSLNRSEFDSTSVTQIQFMIEFRILGFTCIPSRIHSLGVVYSEKVTDSHYEPSMQFTNASTPCFAWRFATAFGTTVPTLRVRLYDADTNNLLVDDNTNSPKGTFEQSTNGGAAWIAWTSADKLNEQTYLRYTPVALPSGLKIRMLLTQK